MKQFIRYLYLLFVVFLLAGEKWMIYDYFEQMMGFYTWPLDLVDTYLGEWIEFPEGLISENTGMSVNGKGLLITYGTVMWIAIYKITKQSMRANTPKVFDYE
ncbi:hypothetical protein HOH87_02215 [bacterium]|jgi:hypothetical protein|nr:hypothetical protein [bacterium]